MLKMDEVKGKYRLFMAAPAAVFGYPSNFLKKIQSTAGLWPGEPENRKQTTGLVPEEVWFEQIDRLAKHAKDLIISGGYNVYPKEIESFIDDMAGVDESAVIGVPHPDFGEAVVAVVVAKPGAKLNSDAMIADLKGKIANFKVPKRVEILESLPRNAMGKVQKNILREQYSH